MQRAIEEIGHEYWPTNRAGDIGCCSTCEVAECNPDGTQMLWGDDPHFVLHRQLVSLIERLRVQEARFPTCSELAAQIQTAPEIKTGVLEAAAVFLADIGRPPTDDEIGAGLAHLTADLPADLAAAERLTLLVGDAVAITVPQYFPGTVESGADGMLFIRTADGRQLALRDCEVRKVLPSDPPLGQQNPAVWAGFGDPPF